MRKKAKRNRDKGNPEICKPCLSFSSFLFAKNIIPDRFVEMKEWLLETIKPPAVSRQGLDFIWRKFWEPIRGYSRFPRKTFVSPCRYRQNRDGLSVHTSLSKWKIFSAYKTALIIWSFAFWLVSLSICWTNRNYHVCPPSVSYSTKVIHTYTSKKEERSEIEWADISQPFPAMLSVYLTQLAIEAE